MNETTPRQPENVTARRKTSRLPLIAFATLPLTVGLVLAQQGTTTAGSASTPDVTAQAQRVQPVAPGQRPSQPGTQPGQTAPRQFSGTNYADVFLQKLAAQLGISVTKLKSAAIAAGSATIDQGVKAGDFPSDRAAEMKQRLQQNPFAIGGGRGMRGPGGPGHGPDGGPGGGPRGQDQTAPAAPSGSTSGTSGT
ncbi:hypothetical protein HNQ07_001011 [Deinococcus metalli]|uniref:Uncharacterized protein n=1 Tax=Deinococcus metalli TaxID=1141878 RepID=A0A7W8KCB0_9DEIO|nr:hypothetical protein [Deinococcus metalli]MBB5375567.1 hypothetical protein [Deinococcus metalli]GHF28311.1 hypothetical protein GCM10017781_00280 [Deinococcus metalli]